MTRAKPIVPDRRYGDVSTVNHQGGRAPSGGVTDAAIAASERLAYAAAKQGSDSLLRALNRYFEKRRASNAE